MRDVWPGVPATNAWKLAVGSKAGFGATKGNQLLKSDDVFKKALIHGPMSTLLKELLNSDRFADVRDALRPRRAAFEANRKVAVLASNKAYKFVDRGAFPRKRTVHGLIDVLARYELIRLAGVGLIDAMPLANVDDCAKHHRWKNPKDCGNRAKGLQRRESTRVPLVVAGNHKTRLPS